MSNDNLDLDEIRPTIDLVKETVSLTEVAEMLDLDIDNTGKIRPPWNPDERTPSCQLYESDFYDFSTGRWGDFVDLVRAVYGETEEELPTGKIIRLVWNKALRSGHEPGDVEAKPVKVLHDFTDELLSHPNIEPDMGPFGVRLDGITQLIPHRDENGTYGVKTRGPAGKTAWPGSQFTHRLYDPYGWNPTLPVGGDLVICEGESDSWAMCRALPGDVRVLALPSGAAAWKDFWMDDIEMFRRVFLCFDNDRAGKQATDKVLRKVGWAKGHTLKVPGLYNDAREAIEAGWAPQLPSM